MKTLSLLAMLGVCVIIHVHAQEEAETPEGKLFEEAAARFEAGDFLTAAVEFEQVMKKYPKSEFVARAHFNKALCYYHFKDVDTAEKIFLEILDQRYNEKDPNGLMEPYTLYKHRACRFLANMALDRMDYPAAEKYINLFDKKYPYQHFCGNEWSAYYMFKAVMYAKVYVGMGEVKKAMDQLLPFIFADGLASNQEVLNQLEGILEKHFSKDDIAVEFEKALSTLESKKTKKWTTWFIKLYGVEIEVNGFYDHDEKEKKLSEEERYKQIVLNNELFKRFL